MTVANERNLMAQVQYFSAEFVEFLEMIGRIAQSKTTESLAEAIEGVLDDILPYYNLKRNPVLANVEEESGSDDDYWAGMNL